MFDDSIPPQEINAGDYVLCNDKTRKSYSLVKIIELLGANRAKVVDLVAKNTRPLCVKNGFFGEDIVYTKMSPYYDKVWHWILTEQEWDCVAEEIRSKYEFSKFLKKDCWYRNKNNGIFHKLDGSDLYVYSAPGIEIRLNKFEQLYNDYINNTIEEITPEFILEHRDLKYPANIQYIFKDVFEKIYAEKLFGKTEPDKNKLELPKITRDKNTPMFEVTLKNRFTENEELELKKIEPDPIDKPIESGYNMYDAGLAIGASILCLYSLKFDFALNVLKRINEKYMGEIVINAKN